MAPRRDERREAPSARKARRLVVQGTVQGVGFRPFVYRLASSLGLSGRVRNTPSGVEIEVEGAAGALDAFLRGLEKQAPPLASITSIVQESLPAAGDLEGFEIHASQSGTGRGLKVPLDVGVCGECLSELFNPSDRRHGYPFINCTDCGPRYSIIESLPYDRPRTSMNNFSMCEECAAEYSDPLDRRFHAQPVACPECGPRVWLTDRAGAVVARDGGAVAAAALYLGEGKVVAIKGVGGFHLACDASDSRAVARLRKAKGRGAKPFAVMARSVGVARQFCRVSEEEAALLTDIRRPIVLLQKLLPGALGEVAPSINSLGVMLPYTPLHHLLFAEPQTPDLLVMTSGNRSGMPLVVDNHAALEELGDMADFFLLHDRRIVARADDSVVFWCGGMRVVRAGRGMAPIDLAEVAAEEATLAVGCDLKNAFCLAFGGRAVLSPHVGDLEGVETQSALRATVTHLLSLYGVHPSKVAADLHPDYHSTSIAGELAQEFGCSGLARVQHHHAHAAAVLAEHRCAPPALAVVLDGTGLGPDGTIWGGEILWIERAGFRRLGHLEPMPLPGGDAAAKEPWRMAASLLLSAMGREGLRWLASRVPVTEEMLGWIADMVAAGVNSPLTSSCGRLFDGVASLVGRCHYITYEGQAAMELQALAEEALDGQDGGYAPAIKRQGGMITICTGPLIGAIISDIGKGVGAGTVAFRFHRWVVDSFVAAIAELSSAVGVKRVALSGGCMQNRLLLKWFMEALEALGFEVMVPSSVAVNDGGIALGQAVVAGGGLCA